MRFLLLEKYQAEMPAIKQEIHDANTMLNGNMETIVNGINRGADLYKTIYQSFKTKVSKAAAFMQNDYPGIRKDLTNTLKTVNEKMPDVEAALDKANELIINDWPNIKTGLHKAANAIRKGEKEVDLGEILKLLKLDANKESDFLHNQLKSKNMLFIRLLIMVRQVRHSIQLCVYGLVLYYSQVLRQRMFILKEKIKTLF